MMVRFHHQTLNLGEKGKSLGSKPGTDVGYEHHPEVSCMSPDCVGLALKVLVPLEIPLSNRQQDLRRRLSMLDVDLYWGRESN